MIHQNALLKEFLAFIKKFGVVGLAIGFIVGQAATSVVTSLVTNILTPLVGLIPSLDALDRLILVKDGNAFKIVPEVTDNQILISAFGPFLTDFINFIVLMFVVFFAVKFFISKLMTEEDKAASQV